MPTNRSRRSRGRVHGPTPAWLPGVLDGTFTPQLDGPEYSALCGWHIFEDDAEIPGLPRNKQTVAAVSRCLWRGIGTITSQGVTDAT